MRVEVGAPVMIAAGFDLSQLLVCQERHDTFKGSPFPCRDIIRNESERESCYSCWMNPNQMSLSEKDVLQVALFLDFSRSTNVKEVRHQVGKRFYDGSNFSREDRHRVLDKLAAIQELYLPPHQI